MIVSYYIIYTNHFDRPGIKVTICKINNFSIATSICPKHNSVVPKPVVENFSTQRPTKITLEVAYQVA